MLSEELKRRHSVMILTGAGVLDQLGAAVLDKTEAIANSASCIKPPPTVKQVTLNENLDEFAKELKAAAGKPVWFVFKGNDDPKPYENLMTLMDDNTKLVHNGEEIPLAVDAGQRVVFVEQSCEKMSPAAISRCGIIIAYSTDEAINKAAEAAAAAAKEAASKAADAAAEAASEAAKNASAMAGDLMASAKSLF